MAAQDDEKLERIFARMREPAPGAPGEGELAAKWPSIVERAHAQAEERGRARRRTWLLAVSLAAALLLSLGAVSLVVHGGRSDELWQKDVLAECWQRVGFDAEQQARSQAIAGE